jgi:hypothetical protein
VPAIKWQFLLSVEPLNVGAEWPEVTPENTRRDIFDALVTHPTLGVMCPEVGFIQQLLCTRCGSPWSQKIFNTDACEECRCRFEWVLAEPAPGQKFDRVSFGRYLENEGSKSARGWLSRKTVFGRLTPLDVVYWVLGGGFVGFLLWIVLTGKAA